MAITYESAKADVLAIRDEIMRAHHPKLVEHGVTVGILMASNDGDTAVKLHGYPCCAVVKKNSTKDRVEGKPDATITIDEGWWKDASDKERRSVMDHELTHLVVAAEVETISRPSEIDPEVVIHDIIYVAKLDAAGRPKLLIRLHDWQLGGFAEIVERHGEDAVERQAFQETAKKYEQLLLAWG